MKNTPSNRALVEYLIALQLHSPPDGYNELAPELQACILCAALASEGVSCSARRCIYSADRSTPGELPFFGMEVLWVDRVPFDLYGKQGWKDIAEGYFHRLNRAWTYEESGVRVSEIIPTKKACTILSRFSRQFPHRRAQEYTQYFSKKLEEMRVLDQTRPPVSFSARTRRM